MFPRLTSARRFPTPWTSLFMIVLLLGVLALVGCGQHLPSDGAAVPEEATPSVAHELSATVTDEVALPPESSSPITELIGDPSGAGAWFWDVTATGDTIYHVDADGTLKAYPVSQVGAQARSGLAVSSTGVVWFGINTTLIALDSQTGKTQQWSIPAGRANPNDQRTNPQDMAGKRAVDALAVSPNGQVAIAMNAESSVVEFDPKTATFSSLALPTVTDKALSVTYSSDDTLCVGLSDLATGGPANEVFLVSPTGKQSTATVPSGTAWEVGPYAASTFVVGSFDPHLVTSSGEVTAIQAPPELIGSANAPTPLIVLPNGQLLGVAAYGLIEFPGNAASSDAAAANATLLAGAKVPCRPDTMTHRPGLPTPTPIPAGAMCPTGISDVVTIDSAGNLWVVSPHAQATVAMVKRP